MLSVCNKKLFDGSVHACIYLMIIKVALHPNWYRIYAEWVNDNFSFQAAAGYISFHSLSFFLKKEDIYTVPNLLSTFRILITPVLGYLIVTEDFVSSLIFFGVAGVTDMVWYEWTMLQSHFVFLQWIFINPLHPRISMHILHTAPYTFAKVQARRICLALRASSVGDHFLFSHDINVWFRGDIV